MSKLDIDNVAYDHYLQVRLAEPLRPALKLASLVVPRTSSANSHRSKVIAVCPETAEAESIAAKTTAKEERLKIAMLVIGCCVMRSKFVSDRCCENLQLLCCGFYILVIMCFQA